jgi:hypothetical protein
MLPSRGMGAIRPSKMPKAKTITRKDDPNEVEMFSGGGLYANIAAKKKRIAAGSGEKMRKAGAKGAPKKSDFANAAKTASFKEGGSIEQNHNEPLKTHKKYFTTERVTLIPRSWVVAALTNLGKVLEEEYRQLKNFLKILK